MSGILFEHNKLLREFSNYKIGGVADYFCAPKTVEEIVEALRDWGNRGEIFILGGGTNLLISDSGFRGLVIKPELSTITIEGTNVRVGAGAFMSDILIATIDAGLSGLEWAGGLPGTVGGAARGNAGAFGGETKDCALEVRSVMIDAENPQRKIRKNDECNFGYRNSIFKENDCKEIITEVILQLVPGDCAQIAKAIEEKKEYRRTRHPIEYPNIGSIFKNVALETAPKVVQQQFAHVIKKDPFPVIPTACLLAEANLKGVVHGGAMISPKHPNFIVNMGSATAYDVQALIALIKKTILEKFGVTLEEEVIEVGFRD